MKKLFLLFLVVVAITFGPATVPEGMPQVSAQQQYWNGDTNYPMVYGHMGVTWYLDASSVVVKQDVYEGQDIDRIWAENIISVAEDGNAKTHTYWYRDNCGTMYFHRDDADWQEFDPFSYYGTMQVVVNGCKLGWRIAFVVPFS